MRALRLHFFVGFAMVGATGPFFPEFLRSTRGFSAQQIGAVLAASQFCIMIAPVVLTLMADRGASPRVLAASIFGLAAATLAGLWGVEGFVGTLLLYTVLGFAVASLFPSSDGLFFAVQRKRSLEGLETPPYHRVRVLGTIGFALPSIALLWMIPADGSDLSIILPTGAGLAVIAMLNAFALPDPRVSDAAPPVVARRLPSMEAAGALLSRPALGFCLAMALQQIAHTGYFAFYPVHLVQSLDVPARWLGAVSTVGLVTEAVLLVGFGWFSRTLGARHMLALGAVLTAVRHIAIAVAPDAWIAIAANALHGPIVLFTLIAPVLFINELADDAFRNSMQGVYTMAVLGPARIGGNLLCGWLASIDTRLTFFVGAAAAVLSAVLLFVFVRNPAAADQPAR